MRSIVVLLIVIFAAQIFGQDLSPEDVTVRLDEALPIALKEARKQFPELDEYLLYSVSPRVLKGDRKGLFWQFLWQEKRFPHTRNLVVRVYMKDRSIFAERADQR